MGIKFLKDKDNFDIQFFDDLTDIRILRLAIGVWLEDMRTVSEFKIYSTKLCLEELVYNAILHAYSGNSESQKIVYIKIKKINDFIEMTIKDNGKKGWFNNYVIPNSIAETDTYKLGGRGLIIIKSITEELKIINNPMEGTEVFVKINLIEKK